MLIRGEIMNNMKIIALDNIKEIGKEVNAKLNKLRNTNKNYMLNITSSRFSNGEGKVKIEDSVREKDIYLLADVGNYGITYNMHGFTHHMAPDEHFQDIKRTISAISGYKEKITLIMPLLYQSRQHKRKGRESALLYAMFFHQIPLPLFYHFQRLDNHLLYLIELLHPKNDVFYYHVCNYESDTFFLFLIFLPPFLPRFFCIITFFLGFFNREKKNV